LRRYKERMICVLGMIGRIRRWDGAYWSFGYDWWDWKERLRKDK